MGMLFWRKRHPRGMPLEQFDVSPAESTIVIDPDCFQERVKALVKA